MALLPPLICTWQQDACNRQASAQACVNIVRRSAASGHAKKQAQLKKVGQEWNTLGSKTRLEHNTSRLCRQGSPTGAAFCRPPPNWAGSGSMSITSAGKASIQMSSRARSAAGQGSAALHGMLMLSNGKQGRPRSAAAKDASGPRLSTNSGNARGTSKARKAADRFVIHLKLQSVP